MNSSQNSELIVVLSPREDLLRERGMKSHISKGEENLSFTFKGFTYFACFLIA